VSELTKWCQNSDHEKPQSIDPNAIEALADHKEKTVSEANLDALPSENDWSRVNLSLFTSHEPSLLTRQEDPAQGPIGEEISPPPLSLSSSSASEPILSPDLPGALELIKVRSKTPSRTSTQHRRNSSTNAIKPGESLIGGSSKVRKSSASKARSKEPVKGGVPHPNQHVQAQERARPNTQKTIFIHRKSHSSESFTGITYTPISLLSLDPTEFITSICRSYAIDPNSIDPVSIWHDPHTGLHGIVDQTFLTKLVNDQDIVFDLCSRQGEFAPGGTC